MTASRTFARSKVSRMWLPEINSGWNVFNVPEYRVLPIVGREAGRECVRLCRSYHRGDRRLRCLPSLLLQIEGVCPGCTAAAARHISRASTLFQARARLRKTGPHGFTARGNDVEQLGRCPPTATAARELLAFYQRRASMRCSARRRLTGSPGCAAGHRGSGSAGSSGGGRPRQGRRTGAAPGGPATRSRLARPSGQSPPPSPTPP